MLIKISPDGAALAAAAAADAAARLRAALAARPRARIIAATGASQFEFLERLTREPDVDWRRVEMFHLDEYIGLPIDHPASFRKYLLERLIRPAGILDYHLLDGEADPASVLHSVGEAVRRTPIDVAFVGIGENGHLAFNDPPADFVTEAPYIIVRLDEACRRQQVGEGWFAKPCGRAGHRDLDVGAADSLGERGSVRRAGSAQGGGRAGLSRRPDHAGSPCLDPPDAS